MRYKFVTCKVMQREAYVCASGSGNIVDIVLMPQGLHDTPDILRSEVQKELDKTTDPSGKPYDAILLGYCLCSNGICGLHSDIPVVIARGHDCMTLLLGSRHRYQEYFDAHKGVYWYSIGWIEHCNELMPGKDRYEKLLAEYTQKFGDDNAQYLMEAEQTWIKEYKRAVFIDWGLPGSDQAKLYTKECADYLGWEYDEIKGGDNLMRRLIDGDWNNENFLVVNPGQTIRDDLTEPHIIKAEPHCGHCNEKKNHELFVEKYNALKTLLVEYGKKVAVAFSGGVDSSFLLKAAADTLGETNVLACIGVSPSLAQHQLTQAREMAKLISVKLAELPLGELDDPNYQRNKADRCFHCKSHQFKTIQEYAAEHGFEHTLCGANFDDREDYRPGNIAIKALNIGMPLMDAKLTKPEIRELSRKLGLPTAGVPASPCLASRIAYGETITAEKLGQVEQAETVLRSLGFVEFRVRHHGTIARIEVPAGDIEKIAKKPIRRKIVKRLKDLGFQYISLDLQGFRSGSLNETLTEDEKTRLRQDT